MKTELPNALCPLCQRANQCAIAANQPAETCWCMTTKIAPAARQKAAQIKGDEARCICAKCGATID